MSEALRVLVVETVGKHEVAQAIRACGSHVVLASDGAQAASSLTLDNMDLILLDLDAARADGLDLLRHLAQKYPTLPILATASGQCRELAPKALSAGAFDYLPKPLDSVLLKAALQRAHLALSGHRAQETIQRKSHEMAALHRATNAIVANLEPDTVLADILVEATKMLNAERASILLRDEATGNLYFLAATDSLPELSGLQVPTGAGLANWVIAHNEPVLCNDAASDPRFYPGIDQILGFKTRNLAAAPLRDQSKVIGAIELINKMGGPFEEHDLFLLQALAMSAAIALRNARLYQEQAEGHALLQEVLNANGNGMAAIDARGRVLFKNPAAMDLLGLKHDQACIENIAALITAYADHLRVLSPTGATWRDYRRAMIQATETTHFVLELDVSQKRILDALITPIPRHAQSTTARLLVWRDITRETELAAWRDDLSQVIIHDLRNPLGLVRVGIEAAQMFLPPETGADSLQGLSLALQGVAQLERRTEILLAVNQLETGLSLDNMRPVSLRQAAEAAQRFYAFDAQERGIAVEIHIPEDLPDIQGDPELVEWAVGNLLYYTLKHSPRPGIVSIKGEIQDDGVLISLYNPALRLSPEQSENLFVKSSEQLQSKRMGTAGVGLYFCKLAAQAHSGDVRVQSRDQGLAFELWFPKPSENSPSSTTPHH